MSGNGDDRNGVPPFSIYATDCIATIICNCRLGNAPMLIMSTKLEVVCGHCRCAYGIVAVRYDIGAPGVSVNVGCRSLDAGGAHHRAMPFSSRS